MKFGLFVLGILLSASYESDFNKTQVPMSEIVFLLNSTDFNNQSNLKLIDLLISKFQSNDKNSSDYVNLFCDIGGIELIHNLVGRISHYNTSHKLHKDIVKFYCGKTGNLLAIGSTFSQFCDKLVSQNVLGRILSTFMLNSVLFDDFNLTEDLFSVTAISVLNCVKTESLRPIIQNIMTASLGSDLVSIQDRFKAAGPLELKIIFASLLTEQNLTEFHTDELAVDFDTILDLRNFILLQLNRLIRDKRSAFMFLMRTAFISTISLSRIDLVRHSNSLLLAESNRKNLCMKEIIEYYFSIRDFFLKIVEVSIYSIRVLHFLCQACAGFSSFVENEKMTHSKYNNKKLFSTRKENGKSCRFGFALRQGAHG